MSNLSENFSDYNLIRARGDTVRVPFAFDTLTGNPSTYKIWFYGKLSPNDTDANAVVKLDTTGGGVVVVSDPSKTIEAIIPASASVNFESKTVLFCEYQIVPSGGGDVQTVIGSRGKITYVLDIVRAVS